MATELITIDKSRYDSLIQHETALIDLLVSQNEGKVEVVLFQSRHVGMNSYQNRIVALKRDEAMQKMMDDVKEARDLATEKIYRIIKLENTDIPMFNFQRKKVRDL